MAKMSIGCLLQVVFNNGLGFQIEKFKGGALDHGIKGYAFDRILKKGLVFNKGGGVKKVYLVALALGAVALIGAGYLVVRKQQSDTCSKSSCAALSSKSDCLCYCSRVCVPRQKDSLEDVPVYVDEARAKELNVKPGCYCKQWDLDNYNTPSKGGLTCHQKNEMRKNKVKIRASEPTSCKLK